MTTRPVESYLRVAPGCLAVVVGTTLCSAILVPSLALLMASITRGLLADQRIRPEDIWAFLGYLVGLFTLRWIDVAFRSRLLARTTQRVKEDLFGAVMQRSVGEFNRAGTAGYLSLFSTDVYVIEGDYFATLLDALGNIALVVVSLALMLSINVPLALVILVATLGLLTLPALIGGRLGRLKTRFLEESERFHTRLKDYLTGFETIRVFDVGDRVQRSFARANRTLEQERLRVNLFTGRLAAISGASAYAISLSLFVLAAVFVQQGSIALPEMVAMVQLSNTLINPLMLLLPSFSRMAAARVVWQRLSTGYLGLRDTTGGVERDVRGALTVHDVSYSYPDAAPALRDVTLRFEPGHRYAVVGESGSGKSTLVKLLMGYYDDYQGSLRLDEFDYRHLAERSLYSSIALLSQQPILFADTLLYNLTLGRDYSPELLASALHRARLDAVVARLPGGLETVIGENGGTLSGGERQRIALCRALLRECRVLIVDELTTGLDEATAREIEQEVLDLRGCSTITVTHRLDPVLLAQYDEIVVLHQGGVAEQGSYAELMARRDVFYSMNVLQHDRQEGRAHAYAGR